MTQYWNVPNRIADVHVSSEAGGEPVWSSWRLKSFVPYVGRWEKNAFHVVQIIKYFIKGLTGWASWWFDPIGLDTMSWIVFVRDVGKVKVHPQPHDTIIGQARCWWTLSIPGGQALLEDGSDVASDKQTPGTRVKLLKFVRNYVGENRDNFNNTVKLY